MHLITHFPYRPSRGTQHLEAQGRLSFHPQSPKLVNVNLGKDFPKTFENQILSLFHSQKTSFLRSVVAIIRHGDRTPKQKLKMEVSDESFINIFQQYKGMTKGKIKLKKPRDMQKVLDTTRALLEKENIKESRSKLEQLKTVLEMYGHFSGINRKIQMKVITKTRLQLIAKWGGELTAVGREEAELMGKQYRSLYPGFYHLNDGIDTNKRLHRLHSSYQHDLKIYASDEGRVQMTAAAFTKGFLALNGELPPILVQMVKSANTNGLLDNETDELHEFAGQVKQRLHKIVQSKDVINETRIGNVIPTASSTMNKSLLQKSLGKMVDQLYEQVKSMTAAIKYIPNDVELYNHETVEIMLGRWSKLEKDFYDTSTGEFNVSKVPDIYDSIKYDILHNSVLAIPVMNDLYKTSQILADIVIPQEYGMTIAEKLNISHGYCVPLLQKIAVDLQANAYAGQDDSVHRISSSYSDGVTNDRHIRTRLYFTSESHIHSLFNILRFGGLCNTDNEEWNKATQFLSNVNELNYMSQIVIKHYEDTSKSADDPARQTIELYFSPGVALPTDEQNNQPVVAPMQKLHGSVNFADFIDFFSDVCNVSI